MAPEDPPAAPKIGKLFNLVYGLQRLPDADSRQRGECGFWLTAGERQITHGYLTADASAAREWMSESGAYKFLKRNGRLRSRMAVKPIPGRFRPPNVTSSV